MSKRKPHVPTPIRNRLTNYGKHEILEYAKVISGTANQKIQKIKETFNLIIGLSTLKNWKNDAENIFKNVDTTCDLRSESSNIPNTEMELYNWIKSVENHKGISLSQILICEKGKAINTKLDECKGHEFSNGWFRRFLNRFNIRFSKSFGDEALVELDKHVDQIAFIKPTMISIR